MLKWLRKWIRKIGDAPVAKHWPPAEEMEWAMERGKASKTLDYSLISTWATELTWRRKTTEEVRVPSETTRHFIRGQPFWAAGRIYFSIRQLTARRKDLYGCWYLDCYGRKVLHVSERFPCFDSYDAINEDRYYRWFFLCENGRLTRIYAADSDLEICVTKDVAFLENDAWSHMRDAGCLDRW